MIEWYDAIVRLGSATAVGAVIGLNRELHHKPSGLRTLAIVGLGAALAVLLVADVVADPSAVNRVLQGLITGIGFLGAGVIVHEAASTKVQGLTTAATIWLTAYLGAACGLGVWRIIVVAVGLLSVVLIVGRRIEKLVHSWLQAVDQIQTDRPQ